MKKVLDYRWEELQFLQEERRRVDSLLKLCEAVKRWVEGDSHPTFASQVAGPGADGNMPAGLLSEGGFCKALILSKVGPVALFSLVFTSCLSLSLPLFNIFILISEWKGEGE